MKNINKARAYVRNNVDIDYINYIVQKSMQMRCPPSVVDALLADKVRDLPGIRRSAVVIIKNKEYEKIRLGRNKRRWSF